MALEDYLLQALNSPLLPPALWTGYPVFFFTFFGTPYWEKLSFGERAIIGLIVGVPIAFLTEYIAWTFYLLASSAQVSIDPTTLWYLLSIVFVIAVAVARVNLGVQLHSPRGYHALVEFLRRNQFPWTYASMGFVAIFSVATFVLNGSVTTATFPVWVLLPLIFFVGALAYWSFLLAVSLLIAPSAFLNLFSLTTNYVFLLGREVLKADKKRNTQHTLDPRRSKSGMDFTSRKLVALFLMAVVAISVPLADDAVGLLTPRVVSISSQTYNPSGVNFVVTTSGRNISQYVTLVTLTETYYIREPTVPFFEIVIQNPSNYATQLSNICYYYYSGCNLNSMQASVTNNVKITAIQNKSNDLAGWVVLPEDRNGTSLATLTLDYYNRTASIPFVMGNPILLNETASGRNVTAYYSIQVDNPSPYRVGFAHISINGVPSNATSTSGICKCPYDQPISFYYTGYPVYVSFIVQPETDATLYLKVQFPR